METVTAMHWWTERLFTFETSKPTAYSYAAGQYARLGLAADDHVVWRPYSMTSAPSESRLEFYGIVVPGGPFTTRVKQLKVGDRILVEKQCYGFMTADRFGDGGELWMLATGTGIGPFISMLRDSYVWRKFERLILVHCVRHAEELAYADELASLAATPPAGASARLQVLQTVTRDTRANSPQLLAGRITTLLENGELEKRAGATLNAESSRIMLCGNPQMIEDTRRLMHARGLRPVRRALPGHFLTENYW
ncbi:MAG TPA: ferredoxin--NADP reductase [Paucimonas sp.]|nr:ferredoxin--NADP reductase [Paucimonas sp.]